MSNAATAKQISAKTAAEVVNVEVDFSGLLETGESLTGAITLTDASGDLTIDNETISAGTLTINGRSVAAGQAILFRVGGGTAGTSYTIGVRCATNSSPAQTREGFVRLNVLA